MVCSKTTRNYNYPLINSKSVSLLLFCIFLWHGTPSNIVQPTTDRSIHYLSCAAYAEELPAHINSKKDMSEMILIPKGPFVFGINHTDMRTIVKKLKEEVENFYLSEYQREEKTLDNFYIDRFEVTNDKYNVFVKEKKHRQPKYSNYPQFNSSHQPVVGIGWADAELYCKWANKRLPTEEEWEKAARGTDGRVWPWGNDADDTRYNGRKKGFYAPINVGSFPAGNSPYGVSDMAGNVWEMTSSNWQGSAKTMKGGSFLNTNGDVRTMVRWAAADELNGAKWLGFRCVMDISEFKREQGIRTQR